MTLMTQELHYRRTTCRLCGSPKLDTALHLNPSPVADAFLPASRGKVHQESYPMDLMLCRDCGNCQLGEVVSPEVLYRDYIYVSTTTLGLSDHFGNAATHIIGVAKLEKDSFVVDIGSNDGTLLSRFKNQGMRVLGVEPATAIAREATRSGVETLPEFFSSGLAAEIRKKHGPARAVTMNNLFANIDDLHDVMKGISLVLDDQGLFVFETSYLVDFMDNLVFDSAYHEHLSYFAVKPLTKFFQQVGMEMIRVERLDTKGGSIRCFAQKAGGPHPVDPSVDRHVQLEVSGGFDRNGATFEGFRAAVKDRGEVVRRELSQLKARGKVIAGYGASATTTTLMYAYGLMEFIDFLVDENSIKIGTLSPGAQIPVLAPSALAERKPDAVFLFAWRYHEAIIKKNQAYLDQGGTFLIPLPSFRVVTGKTRP